MEKPLNDKGVKKITESGHKRAEYESPKLVSLDSEITERKPNHENEVMYATVIVGPS